MAKKSSVPKRSDAEQVSQWMLTTTYPMKAEIETLREIIKGSDAKISERIKWNAPSYSYKEDIVTFGPDKKGRLLLVFHHPFVVKIKSDLLEGDYKDRRLVYFRDAGEISSRKKELSRIVKEIVKEIEQRNG